MLKCNNFYVEQEKQRLLDKGDSLKTIEIHDYYLKDFVRSYSDRDLKTISREEILSYIGFLDATNYSDSYKRNVRHAIKTFYRYLISESFSKFIRVGELYGTLEKKQLLTNPEVDLLVQVSSSLRDKAIIALLFDAALRREELLNLRVEDIDITADHERIHVSGIKGTRVVPLTFSASYLQQYLHATPRLSAMSCKLWVGRHRPLRASGLRAVLNRAARATGINKRVYPYIFRHSRLTELSKILPEPMLCLFAGWINGSKMIRVYVHNDLVELEELLALNSTVLKASVNNPYHFKFN